jgi:hypothetical protein
MIAKIDAAAASRLPLRVRVLWLVSGTADGLENLPTPPKDLDAVVQDLAKLGIEKPRLAAQTIINGGLDQQLRAHGSPALPFANRLRIEGMLTAAPAATPALQIEIEVTHEVTAGHIQLCTVSTQITTPPGHFVVLGVTPTQNLNSVFVVQVTPAEANKPQTSEFPSSRPMPK